MESEINELCFVDAINLEFITITKLGWIDSNLKFADDITTSKIVTILSNTKFDKDYLLETIHNLISLNFEVVEDYKPIISCLKLMKDIQLNFSNYLENCSKGYLLEIEAISNDFIKEIKKIQ